MEVAYCIDVRESCSRRKRHQYSPYLALKGTGVFSLEFGFPWNSFSESQSAIFSTDLT